MLFLTGSYMPISHVLLQEVSSERHSWVSSIIVQNLINYQLTFILSSRISQVDQVWILEISLNCWTTLLEPQNFPPTFLWLPLIRSCLWCSSVLCGTCSDHVPPPELFGRFEENQWSPPPIILVSDRMLISLGCSEKFCSFPSPGILLPGRCREKSSTMQDLPTVGRHTMHCRGSWKQILVSIVDLSGF